MLIESSVNLFCLNIFLSRLQNNVIASYSRLQQLVAAACYSEESVAQMGCPTAEQAAIMLSSVSLQPPVPAPNRKLSTGSAYRNRSDLAKGRTHSKSESYEVDAIDSKQETLHNATILTVDTSSSKPESDTCQTNDSDPT